MIQDSLNLYYTEGADIAAFVVANLSGRNLTYSLPHPRILAGGSVLQHAKSGDLIWGSGLLDAKIRRNIKMRISAVRGPMTRQILLASGYDCPKVYGSPAQMLPRFFEAKVQREFIGILPDNNDHWLRPDPFKNDSQKMISQSINMVAEIIGCKTLVTSSLEGLIIAEAYKIPAVLLRSKYLADESFTFADYYAATNRDVVVLYDKTIEEAAIIAESLTKSNSINDDFFCAFWGMIGIPNINNLDSTISKDTNAVCISEKADGENVKRKKPERHSNTGTSSKSPKKSIRQAKT